MTEQEKQKYYGNEAFETIYEKAKKDYVLVMIDNPQDTSILSPLAAAQNGRLTREFGIRGFPSTLVLDAEGKVLKRLSGYKGSPEALFEAWDGK